MAYKYSVGRRDFGDIDYEGDDNTQIDFDIDYIGLVTNGVRVLSVSGSRVGIGTDAASGELLNINAASDGDECFIQFQEGGEDRAKVGINSSNNLVLHNQYINKHIVFKVNDQGVTREGLRIDGAVPEVVVNEGSESLVDFRVESDNNTHMLFVDGANDKIGINTDQPDYTLDVAGDIGVNQYIYHNGDGNTWINFTDNRIRLNAGGNNFIDCEDPGSAPHKVRINNGGNNIDFVIKDNSNNVYFTADASTSRVGIATETPIAALDVAGKIAITAESSTPDQPADGQGYIYTKSDGKLYWRSYDLSETDLTAAGGGGGSPAGADTQIQFNDGGSNFGASSNLTYDDTTLKVSTTGLNPIFALEATNDAADASPVMTLKRNSASPADADYLGQLKFLGENDADQEVTYAKITGKISDASDGTEDGIIEFANIKAGSQTVTARLRSDSLQLLNSTGLTVDGDVGIGTTSPLTTLHVHADSINEGAVTISQADNSGDASQLDLSKARGSGASPSAVQNSDFIGQIRMLGYDGDSYDNFADIYVQAAGTVSTTSHPSKVVIRTTQVSATSPTTAVTIDENQDMTVAGAVLGKMRHMTHHRYNDGSGTGLEYIPWAGTSEQNSPSWITQGVAPYAGKLLKVLLRSSKSGGMGSTVVGIHINVDGNTTINSTPEETETVNMTTANTTYTFDFSNANHFGPGDIIGVSIDPTNAHGNVNVTCVWEYTIT